MAFSLVIQDSRMKEHTERIKWQLTKKELKDERKDIMEDIERNLARRRDVIEEQRKLVENAEMVIATYSLYIYNNRRIIDDSRSSRYR